jgi:hypothetical protein
VWLQRLWLRVADLPENPTSRHPPSRAKSGLCEAVPLSATVDVGYFTDNQPTDKGEYHSSLMLYYEVLVVKKDLLGS